VSEHAFWSWVLMAATKRGSLMGRRQQPHSRLRPRSALHRPAQGRPAAPSTRSSRLRSACALRRAGDSSALDVEAHGSSAGRGSPPPWVASRAGVSEDLTGFQTAVAREYTW